MVDSDDLFSDSDKTRWGEDTARAMTCSITLLKEAALARCSAERVTSFIVRSRSKTKMVGLVSHVCERGIFSILPDEQASHWKLTVMHAENGFSIVQARVICRAQTDSYVVINSCEPRAEVVPLPVWKAGRGIEVPLSNIYNTGAVEGARIVLARSSSSSSQRLQVDKLCKA